MKRCAPVPRDSCLAPHASRVGRDYLGAVDAHLFPRPIDSHAPTASARSMAATAGPCVGCRLGLSAWVARVRKSFGGVDGRECGDAGADEQPCAWWGLLSWRSVRASRLTVGTLRLTMAAAHHASQAVLRAAESAAAKAATSSAPTPAAAAAAAGGGGGASTPPPSSPSPPPPPPPSAALVREAAAAGTAAAAVDEVRSGKALRLAQLAHPYHFWKWLEGALLPQVRLLGSTRECSTLIANQRKCSPAPQPGADAASFQQDGMAGLVLADVQVRQQRAERRRHALPGAGSQDVLDRCLFTKLGAGHVCLNVPPDYNTGLWETQAYGHDKTLSELRWVIRGEVCRRLRRARGAWHVDACIGHGACRMVAALVAALGLLSCLLLVVCVVICVCGRARACGG